MNTAKSKTRYRIGRLAWVLLDIILVNASLGLAQLIRYAPYFFQNYFENSLRVAPAMTVLFLLSFAAAGMYRTMWRYASAGDVLRILMATMIPSAATYLFSLAANWCVAPANLFRLPRMVYLLTWLISFGFVTLARFAFLIVTSREGVSVWKMLHTKVSRVMIIGAGWTGAKIVQEMQRGMYGSCTPVIVVDDDLSRSGRSISGVPVVRGTGNIIKLASEAQVDEIIVAIRTPHDDIKPLLEKCIATGCRVRKAQQLLDVNDSSALAQVTDLNIQDLLGRPEERLDMKSAAAFFQGKTVLVTGGGGSIGSELCRRLLTLEPERIVLYDMSENYMYDLFQELRMVYGSALDEKLILCVGNICDERRMNEVFGRYRPHVVLHAAAHKHVPLMEDCPEQAVQNNVFGTYLTAQTAAAHRAERFVLISTDKAVNPTNVMGATKRLAEMIIEAFNDASGTDFTAVRFGNVLGSHGSVVPLFERQIKAGGPVTLTHPDIIRFFMTIPEAASLVLQAASMAKGGELFVLDMGQPVKIIELAERMIQLYAQQNHRRVEIVCTGLRPGEKLYEELMLSGEGIAKTDNEKIFVAKPEVISMEEVQQMLDRLHACMDDHGDMVACLHELVPTFRTPVQPEAGEKAV